MVSEAAAAAEDTRGRAAEETAGDVSVYPGLRVWWMVSVMGWAVVGGRRRVTDYEAATAGRKGENMASGRSEADGGVDHLEADAQQAGR